MVATLAAPPPNVLAREPRGAALDLLYDKVDEVLMEGPAGTGKTLWSLTKLHVCLGVNYPRSRGLLVRKTRKALTESTLVEFEENLLIGRLAGMKSGAQRERRQRYRYPNGSELILAGMDDPQKVKSTQFDIILADEANELTEDDWETLTTRNRNFKMPYQQCIAACNPDAPTHWLNQRANVGRMNRHRSRHQDNPKYFDNGDWTPEGRAYVLGKLANLTGVRRARYYEGKWAAAEGIVYDNYDATLHLVDRFDVPGEWRRFRVVDFGYTNPFVCQWWAMDGDGRLYRYRELYRTQRIVADHAEEIKRLSQGETYVATIADHDAEDRATLAAAQIPTVPAFKAVTVGIQAVQDRLRPAGDGKPRLFLLRDALVSRDERLVEAKKPLCTEQEIDGYVWQKAADGRPVKEEPVKVDDHGCDTMRYAVAWADGLGVVKIGAY
jgi:PBSX family phage terminase large subunit